MRVSGRGGKGGWREKCVMWGEWEGAGAEVVGGGGGRGEGGLEHVPDQERSCGGRGFWLRGAQGRPFQRQRTDRFSGGPVCFRALACVAGEGGRGRFGGLCTTLSGGGEAGSWGGGVAGRCVRCCKAPRGVAMGLGRWVE